MSSKEANLIEARADYEAARARLDLAEAERRAARDAYDTAGWALRDAERQVIEMVAV